MELKKYSTVIYGVGNMVMGDDGVGPEVINELQRRACLPDDVNAVDADTGVRDYLFDYILTDVGRPDRIILIDAVDMEGHKPGEVFQLALDEIPENKVHNFTLHQFANVNLLAELQDNTAMKIIFLAVQVEHIPKEISPGLSEPVAAAVMTVCDMIMKILEQPANIAE